MSQEDREGELGKTGEGGVYISSMVSSAAGKAPSS